MKEKDIKEELRIYSERCYAKPLLEAGFSSYRNDLLNWYKIYNGIVCHFHILVGHSRFPMLMQAWWMHPTYVPAILNLPASWANYQERNELYVTTAYFKSHTVEPGCGINIPRLPQLGAERLYEELFPQIERLQSREALYAFRRENIIFRWDKRDRSFPLSNITDPDFADEALMAGDSEMFTPCVEHIEAMLPRAHLKYMQQSPFSRSPEMLQAQLNALKGIEVDHYMELLKERKKTFMKRYKLQDVFEL